MNYLAKAREEIIYLRQIICRYKYKFKDSISGSAEYIDKNIESQNSRRVFINDKDINQNSKLDTIGEDTNLK